MANSTTIQASFLEQVRSKMPANIAFAEELADLLGVSRDSAYRRIRGETQLTIEEVSFLSGKFGVSFDSLIGQASDRVQFQVRQVMTNGFDFEKYLLSIQHNLEMISTFDEKELVYCAKDIPVFYYFPYPDLAAFKMFFWMKTVLRYPQLESKKFAPNLVSDTLKRIGDRIWTLFAAIPSTEIWSEETIIVVLKQLEFYHDCDLFGDSSDYRRILGQILEMIGSIKKQAELGYKPDPEAGKGGAFQLYKNEILIADNSIYFKMGDKRAAFLTYNTVNILSTTDPGFCQSTEDHLSNLINKSTLISSTAERERTRFFNQMEKEISDRLARLQ